MVDDATRAWLGDLFSAIDAKDTRGFLGFLTEDASFRFGSSPAVAGKGAIRETLDGFFSSIAGLSHTVDAVMQDGAVTACEGVVTYTRHDGTTIVLPFADVFELKGELISNYKIYMDAGPLFAQ